MGSMRLHRVRYTAVPALISWVRWQCVWVRYTHTHTPPTQCRDGPPPPPPSQEVKPTTLSLHSDKNPQIIELNVKLRLHLHAVTVPVNSQCDQSKQSQSKRQNDFCKREAGCGEWLRSGTAHGLDLWLIPTVVVQSKRPSARGPPPPVAGQGRLGKTGG